MSCSPPKKEVKNHFSPHEKKIGTEVYRIARVYKNNYELPTSKIRTVNYNIGILLMIFLKQIFVENYKHFTTKMDKPPK